MAIFGKAKKETATKEVKTPAVVASSKAVVTPAHKGLQANTHVLLAPRITEKAAILSDSSVYVFNVTKEATKPQVMLAVKDLFKVVPVKVRMVNTKGTRVTTRATGKKGTTRGHKKAYVYLKKGEKIELA